MLALSIFYIAQHRLRRTYTSTPASLSYPTNAMQCIETTNAKKPKCQDAWRFQIHLRLRGSCQLPFAVLSIPYVFQMVINDLLGGKSVNNQSTLHNSGVFVHSQSVQQHYMLSLCIRQ